MAFFTQTSTRLIALVLAAVIPFCCCSLGLCASSLAPTDTPTCCCAATENDCPDQPAPAESCSCCLKAPSNTTPPTLPSALSVELVAHPAEFTVALLADPLLAVRPLARSPHWLHPSDDPGESARALRHTISLQV